ncbi:MAG: phosphatidate cytidylyltransferase [Actinomycetia bacterium]|nr:phosphatidate cytidylyltransferase [Actinomycetes bacterium]
MADSAERGRWGALGQRVGTTVVGVPLLVLGLWLGHWPLWAMTWLLALVGSVEFSHLLRLRHLDLPPWQTGLFTTGVLAANALHWPLWPVVVALFFLAALLGLGGSDNQRGFLTGVSALFGGLYLGGLFSFLVRLRGMPHGFWVTLYVFAVTWLTDAAAFFAGRALGRHPLLPRVSPGKTWEGAVAGLAVGVLVGAAASPLVGQDAGTGLWVGGLVSMAGQIGDLVESNLKRFVGAKDSGGILPGHGGVLDRFDSALFAMPAAYYLLKGIGLS